MIEKTGGCCLCGGHFDIGEVFFRCKDRRICSDCADQIITQDLMHLTGTSTTRAMLVALGFDLDVR